MALEPVFNVLFRLFDHRFLESVGREADLDLYHRPNVVPGPTPNRKLLAKKLARDGLADELKQGLVVERLGEEPERAGFQGGLPHRRVVAAAHEDDARVWRLFAERFLHFQSIHARHPDIENRDRASRLSDRSKKRLRAIELFDLMALGAQQTAERFEHRNIVVE